MKYYLAIDIGATSGRHILAHEENGKLIYEEIFRFENKTIEKDGHIFWNIHALLTNIIEGMKMCKKINKIPSFFGIDTFGVDYALLDEKDHLVRNIYCYRDTRTIESRKHLEEKINKVKLYEKTGIYPNDFNSIYQLYDDKENGYLAQTKTIMFLPCYLGYLLTGVKYNELSIASTSGLLSKDSQDYEPSLLKFLNLKRENFAPFIDSTKQVGKISSRLALEIGYSTTLKSIFSHDTASAVYGAGVKNGEIFISSGTWSLLGVLQDKYNTKEECLNSGFTNELNGKNQIRFLKNIVGMYIVNQIHKQVLPEISIVQLVEIAKFGESYQYTFDPTDSKFLTTQDMKNTVLDDFKARNIPLPSSNEELIFCVFNSLANCYAQTINYLEKINNTTYKKIKIFGGGAKNEYLNELTAKATNKEIECGPFEATAEGNIRALL